MPPARRGYGYGSGSAVVDGTGVDLVHACQGSCAPALPSDRYDRTGDGTGEQMFCPRAHCFRKTAAGGSARGIAPSRPPKALASEARS